MTAEQALAYEKNQMGHGRFTLVDNAEMPESVTVILYTHEGEGSRSLRIAGFADAQPLFSHIVKTGRVESESRRNRALIKNGPTR